MLQIIYLILVLNTAWPITDAETITDCSRYKDCSTCVKSYRSLPGFQRYCGWHAEKQSCGEPFSITAGSSVVLREPFTCPQPVPTAKGRRYTDKLGRSLFSLTLAVRNSDPTECLANSRPDIQ
uniref:Uncharacterized protein n=1 Tax=Setaria digitata TaxID=48799 RepID=A0A915Q688_9BILA